MIHLPEACAKHLAGLALAAIVFSAGSGPAAAQTAAAGTGAAANPSIAAGTSQALPSATVATGDAVPPDPTLLAKPKKKKTAAVPAATDASATADPTDPSTTGSVAKPVRKTTAVADSGTTSGPLGASGCRTRGFTVNDYGKDGPTADAKRLLDQDIADWTKANSLQNIKVGPKKVDCFQFLNFIVFDEWTCTASAQICWK
jgi:hypothetical protein